MLFSLIGPESDHWLYLSLTHSQTVDLVGRRLYRCDSFFFAQMRKRSFGSLDLVHKEGSLTSLERVRLQRRIDDDWVLTQEERQKLGQRLQADTEKREKLNQMLVSDVFRGNF